MDLSGRRFGRWVVIEVSGTGTSITDGNYRWKCRCDCGTERTVKSQNLIGGRSNSCGCLSRELAGARARELFTTHGQTRSRAFTIWAGMKKRCYLRSHPGFQNYGGRGITICARWKTSFSNFLFDMGHPPVGKSIDRIENGLGYFKENCRWSTRKEQARNSRGNRLLTVRGHTKCLAAWADVSGVDAIRIGQRLRAGWDVERAIFQPCKRHQAKGSFSSAPVVAL